MAKRVRKKRKRGKFGRGFALVLLLIAAVTAVALSPACNIGQVRITGNVRVGTDKLSAAVGNLVGQNIFRVNLSAIEKTIETIPYIKSAKVKRQLPGTITVEVTETDVAFYAPFSGKMLCVDKDGLVVDSISNDLAIGAPVVRGITVKGFAVGQNLEIDETEKMDIIVLYIGYFKENDIFSKVTELDVTNVDDICFTVDYQLLVQFGNDEQLSYKMKYLKQIIAEVGENAQGVINIRTTENVTYREGDWHTAPPAEVPADATAPPAEEPAKTANSGSTEKPAATAAPEDLE